MSLPTRHIGPLEVSAIGLGCMGLSHAYDVAPNAEDGTRLLNEALDMGTTFLDTAALYGGGNNEKLIGKAVMHRRKEFTLASKCVLDVYDGKRGLNGSPEAISNTLDAALKRLNTDYIDLYYLHRLDKNVPIEESVGALVKAKEAGKIGAIGLSEVSAATIRRAHGVHPIAAIQSEYSPCVRNPEIGVLDACTELGIGFVAFSPVARGFLCDAIHGDNYVDGDIRRNMPRFVEPQLSHNLKAARKFNALAKERECTPAQLAMAWVLAGGENIVPIPGTRSAKHLKEDLGALDVQMDTNLRGQISALFEGSAIKGPRYAAPMQAQIDTELFPGEELA